MVQMEATSSANPKGAVFTRFQLLVDAIAFPSRIVIKTWLIGEGTARIGCRLLLGGILDIDRADI